MGCLRSVHPLSSNGHNFPVENRADPVMSSLGVCGSRGWAAVLLGENIHWNRFASHHKLAAPACTQSKPTKSNTLSTLCLGFVKSTFLALWRCRFGELKLVQKLIALSKILVMERKDLNRNWEYFRLVERHSVLLTCVTLLAECCSENRNLPGIRGGGGATKADPPGRHRLLYSYLGHVGTRVQNFTFFLTMSWTEIGMVGMQYT